MITLDLTNYDILITYFRHCNILRMFKIQYISIIRRWVKFLSEFSWILDYLISDFIAGITKSLNLSVLILQNSSF